MDVRKQLSIACSECLNCTGGKVGILSAAPLSLPSSFSDGYQLRKKIKEAGQESIISRIEECFHL